MTHQHPVSSTSGSTTGSTRGNPAHELLTRKEAAYLLRLQPSTLAVWAVTRRFEKDLPVLHVGNRVRYRLSDVERILALGTGLS